MMTAPRIDRLCRVLVTGLALCALPHTAHTQVRSIHGIRYVMLAPPPPGMEELHQDFSDLLRQRKQLVEAPETFDDHLARIKAFDKYEAATLDPRTLCGRCRLRADLPQPRAIGLECSDYAGKYVGLVRFSTADEALSWLKSNLRGAGAARPLNTVHVLATVQSLAQGAKLEDYAFLKRLLRTGGFTVLDATEGLSEGERDSLVWFHFEPSARSSRFESFARLLFKGRFGHTVRAFEARRPRDWMGLFYLISREEVMRRLVDQVFKARLEDEEIHRIPPFD